MDQQRRRLEGLIYKEMKLIMMNGGRFMQPMERDYRKAANEVDEIKYWDYDPNAKHYASLEEFNTGNTFKNQNRQRKIPYEENESLNKNNKKFSFGRFYRAIIYDPEKNLTGHDLRTDRDVEIFLGDDILSTDFILRNPKNITDIVDHQWGSTSPFISVTTNIDTAIKFLLFRLSTTLNSHGSIITIDTNRAIDITEPEEYSRKFTDSPPYLGLHDRQEGYDEWLIPSMIFSKEIKHVTSVNLRGENHDPTYQIFNLDVIKSKYSDPDVTGIINSEYQNIRGKERIQISLAK